MASFYLVTGYVVCYPKRVQIYLNHALLVGGFERIRGYGKTEEQSCHEYTIQK